MKFTAAIFAAGAVASSIKRQSGGIDAIVADLVAITDATSTLGESISAYSGISDAAGIVSNTEAVNAAIEQAISDAGATPTLSIVDASTLIDPVQSLQAAVSSAVDAVIAQKDAFTADGLCSTVTQQLEGLSSNGQSLATALTNIVPEDLQETAAGLSAPIIADLQRGSDAYADCPSGGGDPTSSDSSAEPTPTPTPSDSSSAPTEPTPTPSESSSADSPPSYSTPTSSGSPSFPPSYSSTPSATKPPATTPPAQYTGAAAALVPAFGGIAAAGLAVLAL